jgi:hypothetical protein
VPRENWLLCFGGVGVGFGVGVGVGFGVELAFGVDDAFTVEDFFDLVFTGHGGYSGFLVDVGLLAEGLAGTDSLLLDFCGNE